MIDNNNLLRALIMAAFDILFAAGGKGRVDFFHYSPVRSRTQPGPDEIVSLPSP
jgi:hypothetical protein